LALLSSCAVLASTPAAQQLKHASRKIEAVVEWRPWRSAAPRDQLMAMSANAAPPYYTATKTAGTDD